MKHLFQTKSLALLTTEADSHEHGMKRELSAANLVFLGIGAIIGAGIFVLTGEVAANYTGPAIIISFLIAALACACAGLCYAELASMIPVAGSAYTYAYATVGEFFAWIIGWDLIIEYLFAASSVAVGWSGYLVSVLKGFDIHFPESLSNAPVGYNDLTHSFEITNAGIINLPAIFIVLILSILLIVGVKESARFNNVIVIIKTFVIICFIISGAFYISTANWVPFIPENTGTFGQFGWSGIFRGAAVIFFAYIGFDAVSTAAQEAKNPKRDLPIGILGSLIICTLLYIAVALVITGIVPYPQLGVPDPIAVGVDATGLTWISPMIKLGAIAGLSSVVLVLLMAQPRIFYTMAKDGLLPKAFAKVHHRFKTPYISSIIVGIMAMLLGGFFPIGVLSKLVSLGTLLAFAAVCLAILILRKKHPEYPRHFKTPFSPYIPVLGIVSCLGVAAFLNRYAWITMGIWLSIGLVVYFLYGNKHSRLRQEQEGREI